MLIKSLLPFLLLLSSQIFAQQPDDRTAVIAVIQKMFDGMRSGDSAAVNSVFFPNARLQTTFTNREGKPAIVSEEISKFAEAVGTPHDEVWDERIWTWDVRVDGNLATAWTDYTFFLGDKMSHCGVNAFQLFRSENGWKITQITDTRRKTNCQIEPGADIAAINQLMDAWHKAAATADEDVFFGTMTADGIYLGTDAAERWLRDDMKEWSKKYFEREKAWDFTPHDRQIYLADSGNLAWFEELLDTWMGPCRGSGVLVKTGDGWKLKHYNLAVTVSNDNVQEYIKLLKEEEIKKD